MSHVFISYSRKDSAFVERLERDLNAHGIPTWRDVHSIPGGAQWFKRIQSGLETCFAVIYVDTPDAFESPWVEKEYLYSEYLKLPIVPVKLDIRYISITTINLNTILCDEKGYQVGLAKIISVLGELPRLSVSPNAYKSVVSTLAKSFDPLAHTPESPNTVDSVAIYDYLKWLLAKVNADLRDALYVNLSASQEVKSAKRRRAFDLSDEEDIGYQRLRIERIQEENFTVRTQEVPDARIPLRELNQVILLGDPGAGKTTTLLQLAIDLAREAHTDLNHAKIPVFIPLRKFTGDVPFETFISEQLYGLQEAYSTLKAEQRLILLCDAFNEMPHNRGTVKAVYETLKASPFWVVSCRLRDYQEELSTLKDAAKIRLKPLEPPQIHEVIRRSFAQEDMESSGAALWAAMYGSDELLAGWDAFVTAGQAEQFWQDIRWPEAVKLRDERYPAWLKENYARRAMLEDRRRMLMLCRNPYLLNRVCVLYADLKQLPDNRGALFASFVDRLLKREEKAADAIGAPWIDQLVIRQGLAHIAYKLNQKTEMSLEYAQKILQHQLGDIDTGLFLRLAVSANLLDVGSEVRFTHQLLQEYFASEVLGALMDGHIEASTVWNTSDWWIPSGREETAILLAGVRGEPEAVARWVAPAQPWFALEILQQPDFGIELSNISAETIAALLDSASLKIQEQHPVGRMNVYRVLGVLGADNRTGIGLTPAKLPEIDWVEIPAGAFIYGDDSKEKYPHWAKIASRQILTLPTYRISRYPITYTQFQAFLDAEDGFGDERWWEGLAVSDVHRKQAGQQRFKYGNHPRENVSWYDAMAFCRWLSWRMGGTYQLHEIEQWLVRLPTEQEWEKAARGTTGFIYPYGDNFDPTRSNTDETGIGLTSAVGIFPQGASPYGVLDMSGNVWEWCLTDYKTPTLTISEENLTSPNTRVVRGGSWGNASDGARAAIRDANAPMDRFISLGFRVVSHD